MDVCRVEIVVIGHVLGSLKMPPSMEGETSATTVSTRHTSENQYNCKFAIPRYLIVFVNSHGYDSTMTIECDALYYRMPILSNDYMT